MSEKIVEGIIDGDRVNYEMGGTHSLRMEVRGNKVTKINTTYAGITIHDIEYTRKQVAKIPFEEQKVIQKATGDYATGRTTIKMKDLHPLIRTLFSLQFEETKN